VLSTTVKVKKSYQNISALTLAEAGINKALWEINKAGSGYTGETNNTTLAGGAFDVVVTTSGPNQRVITATGYVPSKADYKSKRIIRVKVADKPSSTGVAFNYGIQAGPLGVYMSNNAVVKGNIYSQGTLHGGTNSFVTGDVIMSGASGTIDSMKITGNAKAHTINDSQITKDAYYQVISKSTVGGTSHPNWPDAPDIPLPFSDPTIQMWEQTAVAGGTYNSDMIIDGTTTTLGPKKINGDLLVTNSAILTVTGTIWVTGNITFSNLATIQLTPDYGANGGLIIADNPDDRTNYGKINVDNNVTITGSGNPKSYVMLISTNLGPTISDPAIVVGNNSTAVVYYTTQGMLEVSQNAKVRAITGGGIHLSNNAIVEYDTGLASSEFSGGPGGAWAIIEWQVLPI
jgi:hypothetical protein